MSEVHTYGEMNRRIVGILRNAELPHDSYAAQRIEELEAHASDLRKENQTLKMEAVVREAIVARLPKCWRLDDNGKLVQDVPVVPTVSSVYERRYVNPDHALIIMATIVINAGHAAKCFSTREAAEAAKTEGEL